MSAPAHRSLDAERVFAVGVCTVRLAVVVVLGAALLGAPVALGVAAAVTVGSVEQACDRLMWYSRRWGIEVLHRTLKSGCRTEQRQLGQADRLEACLAIDLVVA